MFGSQLILLVIIGIFCIFEDVDQMFTLVVLAWQRKQKDGTYSADNFAGLVDNRHRLQERHFNGS